MFKLDSKALRVRETLVFKDMAGNANGDIEMLEFAEASGKPFLNLLLHHDDAEREYAYDKGAEKALKLAKQRGWTIISMKNDFGRVFPFGGSRPSN